MAKVSTSMPLTNKLGDYSIYQMEGIEKLILRAKGGPTKEQIANDPQFEALRKCQSEFAGAGRASGFIMQTTKALNHLAGLSYGGLLTRVCHLVQLQEPLTERGKRPILFSKHGKLLEGMNFNDLKSIDLVLRHLPGFTISRNELKAIVYFPGLFPGINLFNPWNYPFYRLIITLGVLQDMELLPSGYAINNPEIILNRTQVISDAYSSNQPLDAKSFELILNSNTVLDTGSSLVVAIGVQFGRKVSNLVFEPIAKAGCAKIIAVG